MEEDQRLTMADRIIDDYDKKKSNKTTFTGRLQKCNRLECVVDGEAPEPRPYFHFHETDISGNALKKASWDGALVSGGTAATAKAKKTRQRRPAATVKEAAHLQAASASMAKAKSADEGRKLVQKRPKQSQNQQKASPPMAKGMSASGEKPKLCGLVRPWSAEQGRAFTEVMLHEQKSAPNFTYNKVAERLGREVFEVLDRYYAVFKFCSEYAEFKELRQKRSRRRAHEKARREKALAAEVPEVCAVCQDVGLLLECDGDQCSSLCHAKCAGLTEIPEGGWFCESCSVSKAPVPGSPSPAAVADTDVPAADADTGAGAGAREVCKTDEPPTTEERDAEPVKSH